MCTLGRQILNRPCILGRPIQNRPCILGRQIRNRPCILGGTIRSSRLAKCKARISINLFTHLGICRQVQARTAVRMNSVKTYVMPHHNVTLQSYCTKSWHFCINCSAEDFESFIYSARFSAIYRQKVKALHGATSSRQYYLGRFM